MSTAAPSLVQPVRQDAWPASRRGLAGDVLRRASGLIAQDWLVYAIVGAYALIGAVALIATGASSAFAYLAYVPTWPFVFFLLFPFIYGMLGLLQIVHRFERRRRLAFAKMLSADRLASLAAGLALLAAMMIFQGAFTSLKNALPIWQHGFPGDRLQADIDEWMHFGRAPWLYLHAIAGNGIVRRIVEWNYNQGWFIVCFATMFWVAVAKEARPIRTRYFLCYVLCWILIGSVLAGLFLSAGPAFYGHSTGDFERFGPLIAFIGESAGLMHSAATVQSYLWAAHEAKVPGLGTGISAFPSMHVALVTLNALFLSERSRKWGAVGFAYVAFVLASSVYLAWHYAIDGYVAVAVTVAVFLLVRRLLPRTANDGRPFRACAAPLPR